MHTTALLTPHNAKDVPLFATVLEAHLSTEDTNAVMLAHPLWTEFNDKGCYYLHRDKKPKYNKDERAARVACAKLFAKCAPRTQKEKVHLCLDGVVSTIPPKGCVARENYIHSDTPTVWRRKDEHGLPELAGFNEFQKQVPPSRMIPLWGGCAC